MRNNSPAPVAVASRSRPQSTRRAIVIGCGIAGPVVALALPRAGFAAEIHEARAEPGDDEGVFLNVVANGMQVLRAIGIHDRIAAASFRFAGIAFHDERGQAESETIDYGDQERDYGAAGIVIKRGRLQSGLRQAAAEAGVSIAFGRRLVAIADEPGRVVARFADGSLSQGDILVGCDGINSATRRLVFPDAPRPVFTGLYGYGGFSRGHGLPKGERFMHMYFGRRAFFGYATAPDDEVFWFGNVDGPGAGDTLAGGDARLQAIELHEGDPDPVPPIVRATASAVGWYPIHEMPPLRYLACGPGGARRRRRPRHVAACRAGRVARDGGRPDARQVSLRGRSAGGGIPALPPAPPSARWADRPRGATERQSQGAGPARPSRPQSLPAALPQARRTVIARGFRLPHQLGRSGIAGRSTSAGDPDRNGAPR